MGLQPEGAQGSSDEEDPGAKAEIVDRLARMYHVQLAAEPENMGCEEGGKDEEGTITLGICLPIVPDADGGREVVPS